MPLSGGEQRAALMKALRAVDEGLVVDEDRAVDLSRDVCLDMRDGKDAATVRRHAKTRFEGATVPSLTDDRAADIVAAVRSSFCG
ncbi:DUF732 domain-containing protein [Streptomyces sp. NPDC048295]|uniref:DUF732 domain-containing protein n=1 Tax=Streptomyces sp. NPDC048295 TaxID=3154617 RepID=UPI00343EF9D5